MYKFLNQYPQFWNPKPGDYVLIANPKSRYDNKLGRIHTVTTQKQYWGTKAEKPNDQLILIDVKAHKHSMSEFVLIPEIKQNIRPILIQ